ncbi:hypothetical protein EVAR_75304_1 [Eumeta japonica]|uniref:Uncharacterized protein n=1 Tax=Eumeta variegata TaxID=151549 RepID=A0A4C1YYB2_EUMVA|nr:hypothetical protein EVAR_75304_1 [Eumeta japonica]
MKRQRPPSRALVYRFRSRRADRFAFDVVAALLRGYRDDGADSPAVGPSAAAAIAMALPRFVQDLKRNYELSHRAIAEPAPRLIFSGGRAFGAPAAGSGRLRDLESSLGVGFLKSTRPRRTRHALSHPKDAAPRDVRARARVEPRAVVVGDDPVASLRHARVPVRSLRRAE